MIETTVIFENKITKKNITKLISSIDIMFINGADRVNLYFSSEGGSGSFAFLLIDYLNKNRDRITLKIFGNLFSAGVWVAKYSKCSKELLPEIHLMIHTANILNGNIKDLDKEHNSSTWGVSQLNNKSNIAFLKEVEFLLLPEERDLYIKGEDVYIIDQERINKIIA